MANNASIQKENIYITSNPDKIYLSKGSDGKWYSRVTLQNITHSYIIFKVFINKAQLYSANPSVGFLEPKGSVEVNIKRTMSDSNDDWVNEKDKFMIKAFISQARLSSVEEAKKLITSEELTSPLTQALYLVTAVNEDNRKSMLSQKSIRDSDINSDNTKRTESINEDKRSVYTVTTNYNNPGNPFQTKPSESLDDWKKKVASRKNEIRDLEYENEKLTNQKNNLMQNAKNYMKKVSVVGEKDKNLAAKTTYPMFFIIFVVTVGLIFGAFLNKLV